MANWRLQSAVGTPSTAGPGSGWIGAEWLDHIIRDKAHSSLEYVFTLLSIARDRAPLMAPFLSLHSGDRYLCATALEYLEGILPNKHARCYGTHLQERPP